MISETAEPSRCAFAFAGVVRESKKRLPRQVESLDNPGVAPVGKSGPRYTEAASRQAAFVLNGSMP
jgi:hypothetical protein